MVNNQRKLTIIVNDGRKLIRLPNEKKWRIAIDNKLIDRNTIVTCEYEGGDRSDIMARDCPELAVLLDEYLGPEPEVNDAPPAETPPETPDDASIEQTVNFTIVDDDNAVPQGKGAAKATLDASAPIVAPPIVTETQLPPAAPPPPPAAEPAVEPPAAPPVPEGVAEPVRGVSPFLVALCIVVVCGGIMWLAIAIRSANDGEAVVYEEPEPESVVRYVSAKANLRAEATGTSRARGSIARGEEVQGYYVPSIVDPSINWFRITSGEHAGKFTYGPNLVENEMPAIETFYAGKYRILADTVQLAQPSDTSPQKGSKTVSIGSELEVMGTVNGKYAEIYNGAGDIGYIDWRYFGGPGGKGERATIRIVNDCNSSKSFYFAWKRIAGDWLLVDRYISANSSYELRSREGEALTNTSELYYSISRRQRPPFNTISYSGAGEYTYRGDNKSYKLAKALPRLTPQGVYEVTFEGALCATE
jgi:hypothetical protein